MLHSHKRIAIDTAVRFGFESPKDSTKSEKYWSAIEFLNDSIDQNTVNELSANRIAQHGIGNVYMDYILPIRGKEWIQGNLAYDTEKGYTHIAVDDDGQIYLVSQL